MNVPQPIELTSSWRKSSYCDTGGQCVEIAEAGTMHLVRDSENPAGTCLAFTAETWAAFIKDIKHGAHGTWQAARPAGLPAGRGDRSG